MKNVPWSSAVLWASLSGNLNRTPSSPVKQLKTEEQKPVGINWISLVRVWRKVQIKRCQAVLGSSLEHGPTKIEPNSRLQLQS